MIASRKSISMVGSSYSIFFPNNSSGGIQGMECVKSIQTPVTCGNCQYPQMGQR